MHTNKPYTIFTWKTIHGWSDVSGVWAGRHTGGKWNNRGGVSACVFTQLTDTTNGSWKLSNSPKINQKKDSALLSRAVLRCLPKSVLLKTKKRANAVWDFDDQKFVSCLTRKEKVFANYFSRWRTNTRKSLNRTWSQCLWAPGTWVTASNVFEFQQTLNHDGSSNNTVNQFSINSQAMPVLHPTSTPGSSVKARGGRETTQRITSRTTSTSSALRRILWVSGSGPTRWKACWGRSPIWTSNKWATKEAKWRLNAGTTLFSLAHYLLEWCLHSGKWKTCALCRWHTFILYRTGHRRILKNHRKGNLLWLNKTGLILISYH